MKLLQIFFRLYFFNTIISAILTAEWSNNNGQVDLLRRKSQQCEPVAEIPILTKIPLLIGGKWVGAAISLLLKTTEKQGKLQH